jgi:prevent-host-death family protein
LEVIVASYTVAEAKNRFPALLKAAERGESVTITRHGKPVGELRGLVEEGPRVTQESLDWLKVRLKGMTPASEDSVTLINRMRDMDYLPEEDL